MNPPRDALIDGALLVWFALTAATAAYVAWDAFTRNPEMRVMRYGWLLVTLYTGPVGAALYVLSCQEPVPGRHEDFIRPLWKQSLGSTIHCMAGDATGIIVAAAITAALGLPMRLDLVSEYIFGFLFGLLVFQALFMRGMLGGSYAAAVRRSLLPEWLSMNGVMAGMIPVMAVLMSRDMRAMEATSLRFWGVMSLATLVGLVVAYPVNVWLVAGGLKHGMGTVRALGRGGHSPAAEMRAKGTSLGVAGHGSHDAGGGVPAASPSAATTWMKPTAGAAEAGMPGMGADAAMTGRMAGVLPPPTTPQVAVVTLLTLVALGAGVLLAALYGDLSMRAGMSELAAPDTMRAIPAHGRM